ncbi:PhzF family phenazine biosynthesis protein [Microlunatus soli]|uniref:Phenazine biosynthesis protein PhzF family n=1 Tax=Microlunatus soli TaxID=630515 RepID=A0A1H2A8K5_9ACTN|nr:PhzF family phenazine biosynthesis protein [Microlunatus soli]SDT42315.1 phenazine biosynthesis protein PhzF family [Microlunatus soli]
MNTYDFSQIDVFGATPYRGNPLAVVQDADGVDDDQLQAFARWTNLSETTFLVPPTDPGADYRVRIFTGSEELPFAGHPTLGTAHAWLQAHPEHEGDRVVQECGVGLVTVRRTGSGLAFAAPPLITDEPVDDQLLAEIRGVLGLTADQLLASRVIDNGPGWVGVLVTDDVDIMALPTRELPGAVGVISRSAAAGTGHAIEVRGFFASGGIAFEDPVTGSLNAAVAQWLLGQGILTAPYSAHQGTAVGADGAIEIDQDADGTVWVGGRTTTMISGTVTI